MVCPSASAGVKRTGPEDRNSASRLPRSVRSTVLMYFLSGKITTYAPMDTSCLGLSVRCISVS